MEVKIAPHTLQIDKQRCIWYAIHRFLLHLRQSLWQSQVFVIVSDCILFPSRLANPFSDEIVMQYDDICDYSTISVPTAAPTIRERSTISRTAEVEVIVSVLLVMFMLVGCYVAVRKWCYTDRNTTIFPTDANYGVSEGANSPETEMHLRISTNSERERQRRLNQLIEQIHISAEQGYNSNIVPTATVIVPTVVAAPMEVPIATVVTVNGVRV